MHPALAHLSDDILRPIGVLLSSLDASIHRQGLELLEALAPAGPDALRGAVIRDLPADIELAGRDMAGARLRDGTRLLRHSPRLDLRGAGLLGAALSIPLPVADLSGADLRFCHIHAYPGAPIPWPWMRLAGACLRGAGLADLDLRGTDGRGLAGADLRGADLRRADLRGGRFSGLDLSGADLSGARLKGTNLKGTRLVGANLKGADLFRANLKGADLTGAIMTFDDTIRWDAATRWPEGMAPPPGTLPSRAHPRYRDRGA